MKFSIKKFPVSSVDLDFNQAFSSMRILCGFHLILFAFFVQWPNYLSFYSASGMVRPELFQFFSRSILFCVWENELLKITLFGTFTIFSFFFCFGFFARAIHLPLFLINTLFLSANPMVLHEPQQLTQVLLFLLFFVPYEGAFTMRKTKSFLTYESIDKKVAEHIIFAMTLFLGLYYFLAGFKKLPDPGWLEGSALKALLRTPYLGKDNVLVDLFSIDGFTQVANWTALFFELTFIFAIFTPLRRFYLVMGVIFHILNIFLFDVGTFWMAMFMFYPLLLFKKDAKTP